jgi:hypothetical protein
VFYSCHKKDHAFGTGFSINKRIKHLIIDFDSKSSRMCRLRVRGQFLIIVLYVHMPQQKRKVMRKRTPFMIILTEFMISAQGWMLK